MDRDGDNAVTFDEFSDFVDDCRAEGGERRVLKSRMLREQALNEETIKRVEDGLICNVIKYGTAIQLLHVTNRDQRFHRRGGGGVGEEYLFGGKYKKSNRRACE